MSHADFKDCIRTPYHIDENGNIVDEDFIETYFDISSAEVKSIAVYSSDIIDDNWAKSIKGVNPNIELTTGIAKGLVVV